ncbi:hypothetical protein SESBI_27906 [Sesbania bispinosa]|nr:hypothetical protein SESBI_27906 [Sesbania bispinosa]
MARGQGSTNLCCIFFQDEPSPSETLGILAFDSAKTMCRLVWPTLNSQDESFLLTLACAERLEDLNLAAAATSRLGRQCSDNGLFHFDAVFSAVKGGTIDIRKLEFATRNVDKIIEKMEKLVFATRNLHKAMESLTEMEGSEKKIQRWRNIRANHGLKVKVECYKDRIEFYKRQVQYYKQTSLWNETFDKVVGLMARIICIVYARICFVFGSLVTGMSGCSSNKNNAVRGVFTPNFENSCCRIEHRDLYSINLCLLEQDEESLKRRVRNTSYVLKSTRTGMIRFPNQAPPSPHGGEGGSCGGGDKAKNNRVMRLAPPSTVGGAGLSLRYASVILFMDRCIHAAAAIGKDARVALYELLPGRLKGKLTGKIEEAVVEVGGEFRGRGGGKFGGGGAVA